MVARAYTASSAERCAGAGSPLGVFLAGAVGGDSSYAEIFRLQLPPNCRCLRAPNTRGSRPAGRRGAARQTKPDHCRTPPARPPRIALGRASRSRDLRPTCPSMPRLFASRGLVDGARAPRRGAGAGASTRTRCRPRRSPARASTPLSRTFLPGRRVARLRTRRRPPCPVPGPTGLPDARAAKKRIRCRPARLTRRERPPLRPSFPRWPATLIVSGAAAAVAGAGLPGADVVLTRGRFGAGPVADAFLVRAAPAESRPPDAGGGGAHAGFGGRLQMRGSRRREGEDGGGPPRRGGARRRSRSSSRASVGARPHARRQAGSFSSWPPGSQGRRALAHPRRRADAARAARDRGLPASPGSPLPMLAGRGRAGRGPWRWRNSSASNATMIARASPRRRAPHSGRSRAPGGGAGRELGLAGPSCSSTSRPPLGAAPGRGGSSPCGPGPGSTHGTRSRPRGATCRR